MQGRSTLPRESLCSLLKELACQQGMSSKYNIGPHGPELIYHFANKFLYQKCWNALCACLCICVCACVCLLSMIQILLSQKRRPTYGKQTYLLHMCINVQDYEVSVMKPVARRTVHSNDDDNAGQYWHTIHDYIDSSAFMPNEPMSSLPFCK